MNLPIKKTVVVIEGESLFREGLHILFQYSSVYDCLGIYTDISEFPFTAQAFPDIILSTAYQPVDVRRAKDSFPRTPLVVIIPPGDKLIMAALSAGADSYITLDSEPSMYFSRLNDVLENNVQIGDTLIRNLLAGQFTTSTQPEFALLTAREKELLPLLARGFQYKEISELLNISVETVKRHCSNIYEKLKVNNRTEAVNKFFK